ncbi:bifunctional precorrin-2 dehydrogenase/sirohydrochlorin ferrochelatase [Paenibacillus sp. J22TS3]|uniref:precorrin-2 dehydrogenase/sirohydrochlorin ferrochelatase family protein n=1 Tax=Paenibacillus sp. J22TS3 TaxID=2807192 RepID=UPI001B117FD4|nr:NAD(P)-dependent oxidoreductase [Paenibacillus sp. J22TS3]GIP22430.1 siroheme synthase [Paenibacillus sp. J22TS3]
MDHYIPIMLKAKGLLCVVVGGGPVAQRKTEYMLSVGASIKLISPAVTEPLHQAAQNGSLIWHKREYLTGDLSGADLAYAATDLPAINEVVVEEARQLHIPVNVSGPGQGGTFISPAVVRRGGLLIAVSTSGAGPAAALSISKELGDRYGGEYEVYIDFLSRIRDTVKREVGSARRRHELLRAAAELDILDDIRGGSFQMWNEQQIKDWIRSYGT